MSSTAAVDVGSSATASAAIPAATWAPRSHTGAFRPGKTLTGMRLGDDTDGKWMFVATCDTCGRQARVHPVEVLTHPRTHPRVRVAELAVRLRCRDCRHRTERIAPVARLPKRAFVAGMI